MMRSGTSWPFLLHCRCGGLGLRVPELDAESEHESAVKICQPLSDQILCQAPEYIGLILDEQSLILVLTLKSLAKFAMYLYLYFSILWMYLYFT